MREDKRVKSTGSVLIVLLMADQHPMKERKILEINHWLKG